MPLRRRVALAFTSLGFVLSLVFSVAVVAVAEDYEHVLASEILRGQAEDYGLRLANGLPAHLPQTHRLSGYRADGAGLPPAYAAMPPGVHEDEASDGTHIGVFDTQVGRLIFVIDLSDIETLEIHLNWFLAGMIVLGTTLSGWLGWWAAGAALRPVAALAGEVDALPVDPARSTLADTVSHDELGRLAQAIDAYQGRLADADEREQAFFADASHEMRTPLAVVQGVTEVLMEEPGRDAAYRARLQRLERGVRDMGRLLDALFGVARRSALQWETVEAAAFLQETVELASEGRPLAARIDAEGTLRLPHKEASLLIGGLIRKIAQQPGGALVVRLHDAELVVERIRQEPERAADATVPPRSDLGRGSALLDRLASRLRWRIAFESPTRVRVNLTDAGGADPLAVSPPIR